MGRALTRDTWQSRPSARMGVDLSTLTSGAAHMLILIAAMFALLAYPAESMGAEPGQPSDRPGTAASGPGGAASPGGPSGAAGFRGSGRPGEGGPAGIGGSLVKWVHVSAAALWVGGLAYLTFVFPRTLLPGDALAPRIHAAYSAFSRFILPVFVILGFTGVAAVVLRGLARRAMDFPGMPAPPEGLAAFITPFAMQKMSFAIIAAIIAVIVSVRMLPKLGNLLDSTPGMESGEAATAVAIRVRTMAAVNLTVGVVAIWVAASAR